MMKRKSPRVVPKVEIFSGSDIEWNHFLPDSPCASLYHSSEFGYYRKNEEDSPQILRCAIIDPNNQNVLSICQVVAYPSLSLVTWFYGPIFLDSYKSSGFTEVDIIESLIIFLKQQKYTRFEPCYLPNDLLTNSESLELSSRINCPLNEGGTFIIDLHGQSEETVFNHFDHSVRKNINKCIREGISVVRLQNSDEIEKYYLPILRENRARMGYGLPSSYPNVNMWKWLHNENFHMEVFLAHKNWEALAGLGVYGRKGFINEVAVAQSLKCYEMKIPAQDLIKWEIIKWAIANKILIYDLTGVVPQPKNEKELGIYRFKKKFGGSYHKYWVLIHEYQPEPVAQGNQRLLFYSRIKEKLHSLFRK